MTTDDIPTTDTDDAAERRRLVQVALACAEEIDDTDDAETYAAEQAFDISREAGA